MATFAIIFNHKKISTYASFTQHTDNFKLHQWLFLVLLPLIPTIRFWKTKVTMLQICVVFSSNHWILNYLARLHKFTIKYVYIWPAWPWTSTKFSALFLQARASSYCSAFNSTTQFNTLDGFRENNPIAVQSSNLVNSVQQVNLNIIKILPLKFSRLTIPVDALLGDKIQRCKHLVYVTQ
jgi:hypothetical protein